MGHLIFWGIVLLFIIMAILIGIGKGDWLIAGYNTAHVNECAKYDINKLRKIMAAGLGVIAFMMAVSNLPINAVSSAANKFVGIGILIVSIIMVVLANTIAKAKNPPVITETSQDKLKHKNTAYLSGIITVVVFLFVGILLFTGSIDYDISENQLQVNSSDWTDIVISLDDIESVTLVENIKLGIRTFGIGSFKLREGTFENSEYGEYTLYSFNKNKTYIKIQTAEHIYVLNQETKPKTEDLYQDLLNHLKLE